MNQCECTAKAKNEKCLLPGRRKIRGVTLCGRHIAALTKNGNVDVFPGFRLRRPALETK